MLIFLFCRVVRSGGKAKFIYAEFKANEDSEFANKDIELSYEIHCFYIDNTVIYHNSGFLGKTKIGITLSVYNRSDKTIFIDLANTFTVNDKFSTPYYIPTATSTTTGNTTGGAVNLGGISNALGAGGAIGSLAGGITVGGSKSNSTTSVEYSQRIVSIPPKSTKKLDATLLFPDKLKWKGGNGVSFSSDIIYREFGKTHGGDCLYYQFPDKALEKGESIKFDEETTPIPLWGNYITYSFDENFTQIHNLKSGFHLKQIIGIPGLTTNDVDCVKHGNNALYFKDRLDQSKKR